MSPPVLAHRLSSLDAAFLHIETDEGPMHIGGVSVLDGDVSAEAYAARFEVRLPEVPRYLQRLAAPPFGLGNPTWEFDPDFDVRRHVLESRLDPPGDDRQLAACVARLFAPRLDRSRPLWEIHVIRGLQGGRTALMSKIHHAMVDGISGVELMNIVFDVTPDAPALQARPAGAIVEPEPTTAEVSDLLREAITSAVAAGASLVQGAARLTASWPAMRERAWAAARALATAALHPVARLPFNRTLTGERRFAWLALPFDEMRAIAQGRHGTANDVALAVIADGIGRWLRDLGEPTRSRYLRVLVPVNLRREDERGRLGNRVSMIPVEVPFEGDPVSRLDYAVGRTAAMKRARVADVVSQAAGTGDLLPAWVASTVLPLLVSRTVLEWTAPLRSAPFLVANLVCTNVPGPPVPLYGLGHRLLAHYPIVPLGFETGLNCALLTYDGVLYVGLLADAAAMSDLEPLTAHLRSAYNDLRSSTGVAATAGDGRDVDRARPGRKERHATGSRPDRHTTLETGTSRPATRVRGEAARPRSTRKRARPTRKR